MKRAAIVSLIIHVSLFLVLLLGLSNPLDNLIKDNRPMVIDFINVADVSAAPKLSAINQKKHNALKPTPETKSVETTPPPIPTKTLETKEPEKKVEDKPEPKPEKKPDPKPDADAMPILKKDAKKKEPPKKLEPKIESPKKQEKKKETPKKIDPKKDKEKKKDKKSDDKALVNLHRSKTSDPKKKIDQKAKASPKTLDDLVNKKDDIDGAEQQGSPAETIANTITANEIDAVRQTISKCWTFHAGSQGAKDIIVDIDMKLDPDGTVTHAEIVDKSRMARDPVFRTAAESAKRAVLDPNCSPLPLPAKKYNEWKELIFAFNPKDM